MVPPDLPPATLARGFRQAYGRDPARDPERRACRAYSAAELTAALAALGHEPPGPPAPPPGQLLRLIWSAALLRLPLPSTRVLLAHQAELLELREAAGRELLAVVEVAPSWLPLVQSRRALLVEALAETMGRPALLQLLAQGVEP